MAAQPETPQPAGPALSDTPPAQESAATFHETRIPSPMDIEQHPILSRRINELALSIKGTRLEALVEQLYTELAAHGMSFRPKCYLADEWGCPQNTPVIGIPFYLATPELGKIESELTDAEVEGEPEILMYFRHEAGHAFNYAYRLYDDDEWRKLFGPYSMPYVEEYKSNPFSDRFVRHIPGWYAQKHPDEDFAETFAVWLTADSNWTEAYAGTPALKKLLYVEDAAHKYGPQPPLVTDETLDAPVEELKQTLAEWYGTAGARKRHVALPTIINADLRTLFPSSEGQPASAALRSNRRRIVKEVNYWTGLDELLLTALVDDLVGRIRSLGLKIHPSKLEVGIVRMSIFVTTLAMNYQYTGSFIKT